MGIEWSLFASKQFDDILDYVEDNFGSHAAQKTLKDIDKRTDWLTRYPEASTIDYDLYIVRKQPYRHIRYPLHQLYKFC